ncbi:MAG TPA: hypothetical protein VE360_01060 [Pyrinomonadaceae bacterium]|nr:hypothetical protein [Pyrinomonadaceae bacterium]
MLGFSAHGKATFEGTRTEMEMGDRPLDDNRRPQPTAPRDQQPRGGYYYDDRTGYEIYNPDDDEEEQGDEARREKTTDARD